MDDTTTLALDHDRGRTLAWRRTGDGPPLLLVNGYAATSADWDPAFLAALAASHSLVLPDNRGMGGSSPGDLADLTVGSMADDLVALADHLGIDRLPVAGWSMGGMIGQELAARAPDRVSSLVLLSTDPGGPDAVPAPAATWARLVDRSGTPRQQATRLLGVLFPPDVAADVDRLFGDVVAEARAGLSDDVLAAQERAIAAWHGTGAGAPTAVPVPPPPVLVATGTEDAVIPPANAALLADRWGTGRVEHLAGCGHAVMAQEPVRLAGLVSAFVDGAG